MIKYDLKLVYDYIAGNDIKENIDELENNKSFMKLVLKVSKDKRMFNLCGDNIRNDLSFIGDVADIFSNDQEFIYGIIKEFLKNNEDNPFEKMEAVLLGTKYIKDVDLLLEFKAKANLLYIIARSELESILEEEKDDYFKNCLGRGFGVLKENYTGYPLSTEFCAYKMLQEIFDDIPSLEIYLHKKYDSSMSLREYGICNFIISLVSLEDTELANYLKINPSVTFDIKRKIERYLKNWNAFEQRENYYKIDAIYCKLLEYLTDNNICTIIDLDLFIYYIMSKFGIEKEIHSLDPTISEYDFNRMLDYIKSGKIDERMLTEEENKHKIAIEEIIQKIINQRVYEEDEYVKENNIISFKPKKKLY